MMNTIQSLEDTIYLPIIKQFEEDCIDLELVGKTIVNAFKEIAGTAENFCKSDLEKNTLYLVAGLFYKGRPIEEFGEELWCKDPNEINAIIDNFKFTFDEIL
ncbi:MAG: hypothetical protein ACFFCS_13965 [Candidatus Hodarchaeota archaeon]